MHKWKVAVALTVSIGLCCAAVAQVAATRNAPASVPDVSGTADQRVDTPSQTQLSGVQDLNKVRADGAARDAHTAGDPSSRFSNVGEAVVRQTGARDIACDNAVQVTCESMTTITFSLPYVPYSFMRPTCVAPTSVYGNAQWFYFDVAGPGPTGVKIDTCTPVAVPPQIPDTVIALFKVNGSPDCDNLEEIACNNDKAPGTSGICLDSSVGDDFHGRGSEIIFGPVEPGRYYIQVGVVAWFSGDPPDHQFAMGDYNLSVDCDPSYISCEVDCEPGDYLENEYIECGFMQDFVNGGCGAGAVRPLFTEIECNTTICGSSAFQDSIPDEDWYQLTLSEASDITLTMVDAQFEADVLLYAAPASCDELGPQLALGTYPLPCGDPIQVGPVPVPAGTYYVVVKPTEGTIVLECWQQYRLTVATSPCNPAEGACCVGGTPQTLSKEDCGFAEGVWYGAGVDPGTIACWSCPSGASQEGEDDCSDGFIDPVNGGCGWSDTQPPLTAITCGQTYCGTAGTFLDPIGTPSENVRDNDWYRLWIGGSGGAPIGTIQEVTATVLAEFDVELILVRLGDPSNPCPTFEFAAEAIIPAGVEGSVSQCFIKEVQFAPFRDMWIIVRPAARGNPADVPCGSNYFLTVTCADCTTTGACCFADGCAEGTLAADCFAADGDFFGPDSTCLDGCCPCSPTDTPEDEPVCGYDYPSELYDPINGGCLGAGPTPDYTGDATYLPITPGEHYCGTVGTYCPGDGYCYVDYDFYAIELTEQADLTIHCYLDGASAFVPIWTTVPNFPNCTGSSSLWVPGLPFPDCEWGSYTIEGAGPGWYLVGTRVNFDLEYEQDQCYRYELYVTVGDPTGACCVDSLCSIATEQECIDQGGVWLEGQDCDPNPCCSVECVVSEGEPLCGNPDDTTNGGCNATPPIFGDELSIDGSVCGTVAIWETDEGRSRDTDWYTYNYVGGDLKFCVEAEFPAVLLILSDPGEPCGDDLTGWSTTVSSDCTSGCLWLAEENPDLVPGEYYLVVLPNFDEVDFLGCPPSDDPSYSATVFQGPSGACCLGDPNAPYCEVLIEVECTMQGGTFTAAEDCDPNPCCDLECEAISVPENEPNCGLPEDTVNPGCNPEPPAPTGPFSELAWTPGDPNTIAAVCGTTAVDMSSDPALRDTDWYTYDHTGGNLVWFIGSEFAGTLFVFGPAADPNDPCSYDSGFSNDLLADCGAGSGFTFTDPNDTPAGLYTFVVVADFGADIACGSEYELFVASGERGACCIGSDCVETWEHICVGLAGGEWQGVATCDEAVCEPPPCPGDLNCDGQVDFDDIDPFVLALGGEAGYLAVWPDCRWLNADTNGDDSVDFDDIDPFVGVIGTTCP